MKVETSMEMVFRIMQETAVLREKRVRAAEKRYYENNRDKITLAQQRHYMATREYVNAARREATKEKSRRKLLETIRRNKLKREAECSASERLAREKREARRQLVCPATRKHTTNICGPGPAFIGVISPTPKNVEEWMWRGLCRESAEKMMGLRPGTPNDCSSPPQRTLHEEWASFNWSK